MKASALITNYNYGRFVGEAILSALDQSNGCLEIVVVDDGSVDESRQVIAEIAGDHPQRVKPVLQQNTGQAGAINRGFEHCTGDVVCMLDADDAWDKHKVERVLAAFAAHPAAAMVTHGYRQVDTQGAVVSERAAGRGPSGDISGLMIETGSPWIFPATSGLSFHRRVLERILPIPASSWQLCADGALAFPACFLGEVVSLDEVLGSYRVHGANNYCGAALDPEKVQADVEMTNGYINEFLARIGRPERIDLADNLLYRRDRFYRHGGGLGEALAIARLILGWPMYSRSEKGRFLLRFFCKSMYLTGHGRQEKRAFLETVV